MPAPASSYHAIVPANTEDGKYRCGCGHRFKTKTEFEVHEDFHRPTDLPRSAKELKMDAQQIEDYEDRIVAHEELHRLLSEEATSNV